MCSQTKFGIPRIYACDTIFLDLMAVVKMSWILHDAIFMILGFIINKFSFNNIRCI